MNLIIRLVLGVLTFGAAATATECASYLDASAYHTGSNLNIDPTLTITSRRPEPGSLEHRHPGIARAVLAVQYGRMPYFRWPFADRLGDEDAREFLRQLWLVHAEALALPDAFALDAGERVRFVQVGERVEQLLATLARNYDPFSPTSIKIDGFTSVVTRVQSLLFELFVSLFIAGEDFVFDVDVLRTYLGPRVYGSGKVRRHRGEREIDIVFRRGERDVWVEVKNNAMEWTPEDYAAWSGAKAPPGIEHAYLVHRRMREHGMGGALINQIYLQIQTRRHLQRDASTDILVITKYPIPIEQQRALRNLGVETWSIFGSAQEFLPSYFAAITAQVAE